MLCDRARRMAPLDAVRAIGLLADAIGVLGRQNRRLLDQNRRILEIVTAAAVAAGALAPPPNPDPDPDAAAASVVRLKLDGDHYIAVTSGPMTPAMIDGLQGFVTGHRADGEGT